VKIHPVKNATGDNNRYCGPAALSIITGMTTGEAARLLRFLSGKASIKGTTTGQMMRAFKNCGVTMKPLRIKRGQAKRMTKRDPHSGILLGSYIEDRPTITQWLKDTQDIRTAGRVFLVDAGNHWQIITGRRFCCGIVKEIISITDKRANRRARVQSVHELTVDNRIVIPSTAIKPKASTSVCPYRKELKALEKKHGFKGKVERDRGWIDYVVPKCETFPLGFGTMHHDWAETLGRVEMALEDPNILDDDGWLSL
jgi:hypothetical protein